MDLRREDGLAMIIAMMAMMLMLALGVGLVLTTTSETMIAGNFRNGQEGLYAADAVVERAMDDLLTVPDWDNLVAGAERSAFIDGAPGGERTLIDGSTIDLDEVLNVANCHKTSGCSPEEMDDPNVPGRPWGPNNPRWHLYAYGRISDMLPTATINSPWYVVLMVADDPSESDGDPTKDGAALCLPGVVPPNCNPGSGVLALRAEAFGPRGAHKIIEVTVATTDTTDLERGYTGQRGQDEQNRRARKAAVQTPGRGITMQDLDLTTGAITDNP